MSPASSDFEVETHNLRQWLNRSGTPTEPLRRELATWLCRMTDTPSEVVGYIADALNEYAIRRGEAS